MNRREFIKAAAIATMGLGFPSCADMASSSSNRKATRKPNFIIIFTDDQGYADVGCFAAEGFKTPNLDRMAAEGMRFSDFYSAAPSCTPSRAALLTGCYPQRVSLPHVIDHTAKTGISAKENTIAEVLKTRGYATACFGKWHLGHLQKFLPTRHGFDEFFGLPYSNDMWPHHPTSKNYYPDLPLMEGEKILEYNPDQTQLTTWYTERAVNFIESHKDQPFFLYMAHSMPHVPLHVSEKFKGKSQRGIYGDVIMEIDWSVGEILLALKRCGVDEKTILVFTSDNGPWMVYGDHGGSAKPLRNSKGSTFEGGMRQACIMRWPDNIPAGTMCHEMTTTMDILPTFAKLAGAKLPRQKIDGKDIRPLMSGQANAKSPHEAFFYYAGYDLQAVRSGKWKLHLTHPYKRVVEKGKDGKPGRSELRIQRLALYNLEEDIGEKHNVAARHPDIVKRLKLKADEMTKELGDALTEVKGRNVRPAGRI